MTEFNEKYSYIKRNTDGIKKNIAEAAEACGRNAADIDIVAAVKYADIDEVNYLHTVCGINDIGENRVQQLLERWDTLDREGLNVHFIGSLQTNKVKYIVDKVCMIHSVDSEKLAAEIQRQCAKIGKTMDVLVEINCGREDNKTGILPEDAEALCAKIAEMPNLKLRGFMTMAPRCESDAEYEKYFSETYDLIIDICNKKIYNIESPIISMGMSGSIKAAVRCGSTCVRVGRALFAE